MIDIESDQTFSDDQDVILPSRLSLPEITLELDKEINQNNRKRKRVFCGLEKIFSSYDEAVKSIQDKWTYFKTHPTKTGLKKYYKCSLNQKCPASIHLHILDDRKDVNLYRNQEEHKDDIIMPNSIKRLRKEIKIKIIELYELRVTQPLKIIYCLRKNGFTNIPTQKQIKNFIARTKKKLLGNASINYKEFSDYCQKFKKVPSDPNEAFVVNFEVDSKNKNNQFVRMVVSSLYLLELAAKNWKMGCIDATYKLVYQGHPVIMTGHVDKQRHFHPSYLSLVTNETTEDFTFVLKSIKVK